MEAYLEQARQLVGPHLPGFLGALAILIFGWIVARILGAVVTRALGKTGIDNRIASWVGGDRKGEAGPPVERWVGRAVYYLVMLLVLVAFFQTLGLTLVTEPLRDFLRQIFEYAPRLIGPLLLLLVAWIVASILRSLTRGLVASLRLEERLGSEEDTEKKTQGLAQTFSEGVYWLVFLLFLPGILGALGLEGLLQPVQNLVDKFLGFVPNLLAAGLIFAVGWFVARVVQRLVSSILAATGVDRLSQDMGLAKAIGGQPLSTLVGTIVYILILIPVLITSLDALALEAITRPASEMLNTMLGALPNLFGAALLLGIAYLVARVIGELIGNLLAGIGFNQILPKLGVAKPELGSKTPAQVVGEIIVVVILLFATIEASRLMGFESMGALVAQFLVFGTGVILGVIVLGLGLYLASVAGKAILASGMKQAGLMATAAKVAIVVLSGAMALRQMGIASEIINLAFGLLLGAVAVAVALAFGLGARDIAAREIQEWLDSTKSHRD